MTASGFPVIYSPLGHGAMRTTPISLPLTHRVAIALIAALTAGLLVALPAVAYIPVDAADPAAPGKHDAAALGLAPAGRGGGPSGLESAAAAPWAPPAAAPARPALTGHVVPAAALPAAHFWLVRPFSGDDNPFPAATYPYGSRGDGRYVLHTGADIANPLGTPVRAAADGTVVYAGDDAVNLFGPKAGFYGNLVLMRLDRAYEGGGMYLLFGHLHQIHVSVGQRVRAGEVIGTVGMTGIAVGPHLHLEVRQGDPGYGATRNPELWLQPLPGRGVLAGRITDEAGRPVPGERVLLYRGSSPGQVWRVIRSYLQDDAVHADDALGENFALADVPAGDYRLVAGRAGGLVELPVRVEAGQLTFVELKVAGGG